MNHEEASVCASLIHLIVSSLSFVDCGKYASVQIKTDTKNHKKNINENEKNKPNKQKQTNK